MKFAETSYKPAIINDMKKDTLITKEGVQAHLNVSFKLGSHPVYLISETKEKFDFKQAERDNQVKQLIEKNRDPHFKFSDSYGHNGGSKQELTTIMRQ